MRLFAGFDGGGTKTKCILSDETGRVLGKGTGGPLNYLYCGKETAAESVKSALHSAFAAAGLAPQRLECAYVSSAAIKTYDGERHVPFFRSCLEADLIRCEGDIYPIWYAACRNQPAVICIAGTGSIVLVCRGSRLIRVGGWGPQLGDEGSGYDIGAGALRTCLRMQDGRESEDAEFVQAVLKFMNVNDSRKLVGLVRGEDSRTRIASAAGIVSNLAECGNHTAESLINYAAQELVTAILAALRNDGEPDMLPLVLSGGLVSAGSPLFNAVQQLIFRCADRIKSVESVEVSPAAAACALALREKCLNVAAEFLLKEEVVCAQGMQMN